MSRFPDINLPLSDNSLNIEILVISMQRIVSRFTPINFKCVSNKVCAQQNKVYILLRLLTVNRYIC